MPSITILGLGPGEWKHLTLEAVEELERHDEIWLRTKHHPLIAQLPASLAVQSFDALYDESNDFAALYPRIADEVLRLAARPQGVLYAVPGHPRVGETTVALIVARARETAIPVRVIEGLSFIGPSLTVVDADALDGLQVADAMTVATSHHPPFDPDRPVLIGQLYGRMVASDVKLVLMALYPADHPVTLVDGAGITGGQSLTLPLYALDRQEVGSYLSSLWVPPLPAPASLSAFMEIVAHLRAPEGCPWDREQTHESLRRDLLEEAYEVTEAIDRDDPAALREELGDLMLVALMQAQIAAEEGEFTIAEVIATVIEKLVRRHPHVFATSDAKTSDEVLAQWSRIKAEERAAKGDARPRDAFDEVAAALPALTRAQKLAKRAAARGWAAPTPDVALAAWQAAPNEESLGEALLALAVDTRAHDLDAEESLRRHLGLLVERLRAG